MSVIKSFFSAISMYSKIPVPRPEWKEENRRYSLCFFPIIGAVIGGLILLWYYLCGILGFGRLLFSVGCTVIPLAVTGGIHLDGFCDVSDASASWGSREKLMEIMKDSHIGAFAAIKLCAYFFLQTALFSEIYDKNLLIIFGGSMVMSRALSGLAAVTFKSAKNDGTLQAFRKPAHKIATITVEILFLAVSMLVMVSVDKFCGIFSVLGGMVAFVYYRIYSYKRFGGITGDLAGWFLQLCELMVLICIVLANGILEALK